MDFTNDFQVGLRDNTSRQSLGGRRVSFASHVRVRVIEGVNKNGTNPTQSPESPVSDEPSSEEPQRPVTNENAYPGAASISRRRSSARYSLANSEGEDMDLTTVVSTGFLHDAGSALVDEEFEGEEGYDDDDMDVTEVIHGEFIRKRSLSLGVRQPLAQIPQAEELPSDSNDQSQSFAEDESRTQSEPDSDRSEPMEFTMPLKRSMRPPVEHDQVWLALRQATHSGDTPIEPEPSSDDSTHGHVNVIQNDGMDLDDAVQRLMRARESLPSVQPIQHNVDHGSYGEQRDDTFSSTEDSFADEEYSGDRTMNISKVFGRASLGGVENTRMSMGYQESTMDESQIYGAIVQLNQSTPRQSLARPPSPIKDTPPTTPAPKPSVFHPPPPKPISNPTPTFSAPVRPQQSTIPVPFSFTPRVASPSKGKAPVSAPSSPSKGFSAAFAPSVARASPKKIAPKSPSKRPRQTTDGGASDIENMDLDRPSPSKRPAVADKWQIASAPADDTISTTAKPKPLSPSKKAPFQPPAAGASAPRPSSSLRRPSGYFARRKSLGTGLGPKPTEEDEAPAPLVRSSPKKKAGLGLGRASMGSGASNTWARFDKYAGSGLEKGKEKAQDAHECVREASRQAVAAPSPTRGSPAPASPRPSSPAPLRIPLHEAGPSSPIVHAVDISTLLGPGSLEEDEGAVSMEIDPTEQWREGVEQNDFVEEDNGVSYGMPCYLVTS